MVRSILRMSAVPGRRDDLVAAFRAAAVLDRSSEQDGFMGGELLLAEADDDLVVIALWRDRAAYAGWLASPVREEVSVPLLPLIAGESSEIRDVAIAR
jgi:heme-degrading monooxygenase HmoA